jgi:hypothetical protein
MSIVAKIFAEFNPKGINDAETAFSRFGKAVGGSLATGAIINFSRAFVTAAAEDESAQRKLQTQLENSTGATADQVEQVERFISKTQTATGVLDDKLRPALGNLVRATEDSTEAQDLLGLAIDISVGTGRDLEAVSLALARAHDGNTGALSRLGIQTKDAEGKALSFDEVVQNLSATFGGQADKAMETTEGKMKLLTVQMEEAKETIGMALIPVFVTLADALLPIIEAFNALPEPVRNVVVISTVAAGAFSSASKALEGFGLSAKTANIALGVVGATLGAAVTIYSLYSSRKAEATQRTKDLASALALESDAQQTAIEDLVASDKNTRRVIETITDLGYTLGDLEQYYETGGGKLAKLIDIYNDFNIAGITNEEQGKRFATALGLTEQQVESISGSYSQFTVSLDKTVAQSEKLREEFLKQEEVTALVATATGEATTAQQEAEAAALANEEAQAELTAQLEEEEAALRAVIAAQLAAFSSQIGYEESTWQTIDAVSEFAEIQRQITEGTYEGADVFRDYAEAENAVYEAALSQAAAAAKLAEENAKASGATLTAAESARIQRDELMNVAKTLDPASPLRRQLEEYITTLNSRIPGQVGTVLKITGEMDIETRRFLNLQKRAAGGSIGTSQPTLVGERGPELFMPYSSGQIVSNPDLLRMTSASSLSSGRMDSDGRPSVINVTVTSADPNAVVRALQQYVRQSGPVPVNTRAM